LHEGDWLVALEQDAGRGRQGREWVSARGNFFGSTLVELRADDPPAQSLSLAAGLALVEAVDAAVPAQSLMLKWPNDAMLMGSKVAGILLDLAKAPKLTDRSAADLGGVVAPEAFAPLLAASFGRLLAQWRATEPALLAQAWLARAHPPGTRLSVHSCGDEIVTGRFEGIEVDGALILRRDDGGIDIVRAGDVSLG